MGKRAIDLAERFRTFNDALTRFVEECPDEGWRRECPGERWPVGVVARHVAASHYGALGLAKMMVAGEKLPELTGAVVDEMNLKHAEKHRDCTRAEVLEALRRNGSSVAEFVAGLSDADLDRTGRIPAAGGDMTAEQVITAIIIENGGAHLASMKATAGA